MRKKIKSTAEKMKTQHDHFWNENLSYKVVALFVALILWITILGRRDFVGTKEYDIQFETNQNVSIVSQSADKIRLKISGSQPLIKKFKEKISLLKLDVTDYSSGQFEIDLTANQFNVPQGIRIVSIKPNSVRIELKEKGAPESGN